MWGLLYTIEEMRNVTTVDAIQCHLDETCSRVSDCLDMSKRKWQIDTFYDTHHISLCSRID